MTIRKQPADFRVDELASIGWLGGLSPHHSPDTPHAVFQVVKQSLTTPEAAVRLAKSPGLPPARIAHAGLKDKHARTRQHLSAQLPASPGDPRPPTAIPVDAAGDGESGAQGFRATLIGFASAPVDASIIRGNAFEIVLRGLDPNASQRLDARAGLLLNEGTPDGGDPDARGHGLLFTNYFGDQRFGSARHGEGFAARKLVAGDFEGALRLLLATPARKDSGRRREMTRHLAQAWGHWAAAASGMARGPERKAVEILAAAQPGPTPGAYAYREAFAALPHQTQALCIEAYQSLLWNRAARALALESTSTPIRAEDDFGETVFVPAKDVGPDMRCAEVEMPAPGLDESQPAGAALARVLAAEGLRASDLVVPGLRRPAFRPARRPLMARATEVWSSAPERDELAPTRSPRRWKRTLRFVLPRGSYATVLLRALGE